MPKQHWPAEYAEPSADAHDSIMLPDYEGKVEGYYVSGLRATLEGKPHHYLVTEGKQKILRKSTKLEDGKMKLNATQVDDKAAEVESMMNTSLKKQRQKAQVVETPEQLTSSKLLEMLKGHLGKWSSKGSKKSSKDSDEDDEDEREDREDRDHDGEPSGADDGDDERDDEQDSDEEDHVAVPSARAKLLQSLGLPAPKPAAKAAVANAAKPAASSGKSGATPGKSATSVAPSKVTKGSSGTSSTRATEGHSKIIELDGRGKRLRKSVQEEMDKLMDQTEDFFSEEKCDKFNQTFTWEWRKTGDVNKEEEEQEEDDSSEDRWTLFTQWGKELIKKMPGIQAAAKSIMSRIDKSPNADALKEDKSKAESIFNTTGAILKLVKLVQLKHTPPQEYLDAMRDCKTELSLPVPFYTVQLKSKVSKLINFNHDAELQSVFVKDEGKNELDEFSQHEMSPWYDLRESTEVLDERYAKICLHIVENTSMSLVKEVPQGEASKGKGPGFAKAARIIKQFYDISLLKGRYIPREFAETDLKNASLVMNFGTADVGQLSDAVDVLHGNDVETCTPLVRIFLEHVTGKIILGVAEASLDERQGEMELEDERETVTGEVARLEKNVHDLFDHELLAGSLTTEAKELLSFVTGRVADYQAKIKTKNKQKKVSADAIVAHTQSAEVLELAVTTKLVNAVHDLQRHHSIELVVWSVKLIKSGSLTIKRSDGSEGMLCDTDVDDKVKVITQAQKVPAEPKLPAKAKAAWDDGMKALVRLASLIKVVVKLFIGKEAKKTPSFNNEERKAIEQAYALQLHLLSLGLLVVDGKTDKSSSYLIEFANEEWKKVQATASTEVCDVVKTHLLDADMKVQPEEKELKMLKSSITSAGLAPELVDILVTALDLRIDIHTFCCMNKATATTIVARMMTSARSVKHAIPKLVEGQLVKEEDKANLVSRLDEWLHEASFLATEKIEAFQDNIDKAVKEAEKFVNNCPPITEEEPFMDYLLKRKTDADKAVLLEKELEKALDLFNAEVKAFPPDLRPLMAEKEKYQAAHELIHNISGILNKLAMLTIMRNANTTTPAGASFRKDLKGIINGIGAKLKQIQQDSKKPKEADYFGPESLGIELDVKAAMNIPEEFMKEAAEISTWTAKRPPGAKESAPKRAKATGKDAPAPPPEAPQPAESAGPQAPAPAPADPKVPKASATRQKRGAAEVFSRSWGGAEVEGDHKAGEAAAEPAQAESKKRGAPRGPRKAKAKAQQAQPEAA